MALTESTMLELGTAAPDFSLVDVTTGRHVARDDFRGHPALLMMFICVHCPFVKHIEKDLAKLGRDYAGKKIGIVAVSSNDVEQRAADGPESMKQQAETQGFTFPYLYDATQSMAKAYKAACTPDFFLFDRNFKLVYRGQFDSSRPGNDIPVSGNDLRGAIDAVLAGQPVAAKQSPSIGCNIKWKS